MGDMTFILVAVLAFVSVAGVGWVFAGDGNAGPKKKRVKSIATPSTGGKSGRKVRRGVEQASSRRKQVQDTLKELEQRQKRHRQRTLTLQAQLKQAGLPWTPAIFWMISLALAVIVFGGVALKGQPLWMAAALAFVAGMGLPRWFLGMARKRRMKKFATEFVNAIDIIVRGVKVGLPLNECLKMIAREVADPVGGEFTKLMEEQAMGVPLDEGMGRMYQRMPLPELNFFTVVLAIQQKTGGNLAEALNNLGAVLRARKMMKEKIAALSSEAKASALIIGALPPGVMLIVYVTTPSYMSAMFTEPMGRLMLAGGALWMGAGIFVMRKMINFKF